MKTVSLEIDESLLETIHEQMAHLPVHTYGEYFVRLVKERQLKEILEEKVEEALATPARVVKPEDWRVLREELQAQIDADRGAAVEPQRATA